MTAVPFRGLARVAGILGGSAIMLCTLPGATVAQDEPDATYRISQRGTVSQRIGKANIIVDYSRPLLRGRDNIFGGQIFWGELWTPGANEATVLEVSDTIELNGHTVPAGRWSMWVIPSRVGEWEMVLDARDSLFHTERPELTDDQIRFAIEPRLDAPRTEVLTWHFPVIDHDGGVLQMDWDNVQIPMRVTAPSLRPDVRVAPDVAAPYVGEWEFTYEGMPADMPPDMAAAYVGEWEFTYEGMPADMPPGVVRIEHAADGRLLLHVPPAPVPPMPPLDDSLTGVEREREEAKRELAAQMATPYVMLMIPRAPGIFANGYLDGDELLEIMHDVFMEFDDVDGRPATFVVRGPNDQVFVRGARRTK